MLASSSALFRRGNPMLLLLWNGLFILLTAADLLDEMNTMPWPSPIDTKVYLYTDS